MSKTAQRKAGLKRVLQAEYVRGFDLSHVVAKIVVQQRPLSRYSNQLRMGVKHRLKIGK